MVNLPGLFLFLQTKACAMKTSVISALLLLCLGGCILHDYGLNSGPPRSATAGRDGTAVRDENPEDGPSVPQKNDTSIYLCAVQFDESYEWQRDTAYGSEPYTILLFKNFEPVLAIRSESSACTSPDHDTHHIIDGHLYTECSDLERTCIGRDGAEVVSFEGREFLKGLLPQGEDIYSLSQRRDGHGFTFRKNGELLFSKAEGTPFGGMNDPSYGPTGALYLEGGKPCFCYWTGEGNKRRLYRVLDGVDEEITVTDPGAVTDMKSGGGKAAVTAIDIQGYSPVSCSLWLLYSGPATTGLISSGSTYLYGIYYAAVNRLIHVSYQETALYCNDRKWFAVTERDDGSIEFHDSDYVRISDSGCHFLSPACAAICGDKLIYALSPRAGGGFPKVRIGEAVEELEIHGFISRVAVEISPAS